MLVRYGQNARYLSIVVYCGSVQLGGTYFLFLPHLEAPNLICLTCGSHNHHAEALGHYTIPALVTFGRTESSSKSPKEVPHRQAIVV